MRDLASDGVVAELAQHQTSSSSEADKERTVSRESLDVVYDRIMTEMMPRVDGNGRELTATGQLMAPVHSASSTISSGRTIEVKEQPEQPAESAAPTPPIPRRTEAEVSAYRSAFNIMDHNQDGYISCAELSRAMRSLGFEPSVDDLHHMIMAADVNGSGSVEFSDFVEVMITHQNKNDEDEQDAMLRQIFNVFDNNKTGFITRQGLRAVVSGLGEKLSDAEVDEMIRTADVNKDGVITFEDFRSLCTQRQGGLESMK